MTTKMTGEELRFLRAKRIRLTREQLAEELDVSPRTLQTYETSETVPQSIALACLWIEARSHINYMHDILHYARGNQ